MVKAENTSKMLVKIDTLRVVTMEKMKFRI